VARTPAQVLLRWGLQHDMIVLPKSVHEARIEENLRVFDFELDAASMRELDGLEEGLVTGWDPRDAP
jgi:diketogulonate reductase-like aldo/keto reductase